MAALIIAEAGVNHNGSLDTAKRLVRVAKKTGADAVKFQTFKADRLVAGTATKAIYQQQTTPAEETQHAMLRRLELGLEAHRALLQLCRELDIVFLSSPFDPESADLLAELGVSMFKIGSGEITNLPLLQHIAEKRKPLILSTGMSTLAEVEDAVAAIEDVGNRNLTLLHCVTEYPAPFAEINLRAMLTLRQAFGYAVGYSDHTDGLELPAAAAALGAEVIEKHLTLDRSDAGPDHRASLEPAAFGAMVAGIRNVEAALGDGRKQPAPCEVKNMTVARKSLVATVTIPEGSTVSEDMVCIKRPGDGIAPKYHKAVTGCTAKRTIAPDEAIHWADLS